YTSYAFANLVVTHGTGASVTVECDVTNTGAKTGAEIAQLYVGSPASTALPEAPDELQGFQKVLLTPGQTKHVTITLTARSFSHWDVASHSWRVTAGQYRILVGNGSRSLPLTGTVQLLAQ
ncbi:MAG TPA: fibronectin type III-like domain-contianing protein, partial [Mycobacteriales bacterium]|nr:fibronectin type III-like domain-contianing protein [Mycobacteriales bacterium]